MPSGRGVDSHCWAAWRLEESILIPGGAAGGTRHVMLSYDGGGGEHTGVSSVVISYHIRHACRVVKAPGGGEACPCFQIEFSPLPRDAVQEYHQVYSDK